MSAAVLSTNRFLTTAFFNLSDCFFSILFECFFISCILSASVDSFLSASSVAAAIVVDSASGASRPDSSSTILTRVVLPVYGFLLPVRVVFFVRLKVLV